MTNNSTADILTNYTDNYPQRPSNLSLVELTLWSSVFIFLDIVIIIGNTLVLHYYLDFRHSHRERPKGHYFLINLGVMDLLVGLISLPLYIYFLVQWFLKHQTPQHEIFYRLFTSSDIILGFGSMLTVVLISIDRCSAVVFPFKHRSFKRTTYIYSIIAAWATAIAIALTSLITIIIQRYFFIFHYTSGAVSLLSITAVITFNLFTIFRAKSLQNHSLEEMRRQVAYHKRLSRTFKIVIVAFFFTWLPFQCVSYAHYFMKDFTVIPLFLNYSTKLLQYGGSFINCIIYYINNREFKSSIKRLFIVRGRSKRYKVSAQAQNNHGLSLEITNNQSP